ncbi:MAG: YIP1 family protein [Bacteroidales bacterium]|nr:YIP1 family protein [Bacteroidales bacterium]MBR2607462.1 DUF1282 family protein [Bacteroidaceae bacterium]
MDYKKLFATVQELIAHPAKAWLQVLHKGTKREMLGEFLYPLAILCGTALFLGRVFNNGLGWDSFYTSTISAALCTFSLLIAYKISAYAIAFFTKKYTSKDFRRETIEVFTGYSMVVVLCLNLCLGLFPEFRILAFIAQFYTLKIVWDGAAVLIKINEERRLIYTMVVSLILIVMPFVVNKIMGALSLLIS